ncbi:hypothetical protein WJX72_006385 [[Myrmecia] bisecta]|uniref:Exportin-4 n=1 Tax=[Myrmecia] bisecta TaxID=41462 RepID=A0AAW1PWZ0_9CHLO
MEAMQRAVEQACIDFQRPATQQQAEATLIEFRNSPSPIAACQHILEHSSNPDARFQAVVTLREAAIREWVLCSPAAHRSLRTYVLHHILRHAGEGASLVQKQLIGTGNPAARQAGIQIYEEIVTEFSPSTASAMGLPWDYHERCCASLEADYLRSFYVHAVNIAREAAPAAVKEQDGGICLACISLMMAILCWDFRKPGGPLQSFGTRRSDSSQVRPGAAWAELLLPAEATQWLWDLLAALQGNELSPLALRARSLTALLCSVCGDVFPPSNASDRSALGLPGLSAQDAYLQRLLGAVMRWISPPEEVVHRVACGDGAAESQLLDACRAFAVAAPVHRAAGFERAMPGDSSGSPSGGVLMTLARLTQACIGAGGVRQALDVTWALNATDILVDAWADLLAQECTLRQKTPPSATSQAAATAVFTSFVEAALQDQASGALEDEEEDEEDSGNAEAREEWLTRAAALGRAAVLPSLQLLVRLFAERQHQLHQCMAAGALTRDPSVPLEELSWLLRMGAHLLADPGEGETPMVPLPIMALVSHHYQQPNPVEQLSQCLLAVAGMCLDESARPLCSPRLMEAAIWAVARWADTYLFPEEEFNSPLAAAFGAEGGGLHVLDALVKMAGALLSHWPGEVDLHAVVCKRLLRVLVHRRPICSRLVHLDSWQHLAGAFAAQAQEVRELKDKVQRSLVQSLCLAAAGIPNAQTCEQYITHIMHSVAAEVTALAGHPDLPSIADRPDVLQRVYALLETLRGAAQGTTARAQPTLFVMTASLMQPLLLLQTAYRRQPEVTCLILKVAGDVVEAHVSYLQAQDAQVLCQWVLQLLQLYSKYNLGLISVQTGKRLQEEAATGAYRDLRALLKLLTHLTQRDLVDFGTGSDNGGQAAVDVAQVVFLGLDVLIPLISLDLLKFPKLCRAYFTLLAYMLEVYPERVAALPAASFSTLMRTLEFGVAAPEADVVQSSLEALAALARFHCDAVAGGHPGVQAQNAGEPPVLARFLEVVMRRLLLEEYGRDVVEHAADALLPLILAYPSAYQHIGESLLAGQQDANMRTTLTRALTELMSTNGVIQSTDRTNRKRFRMNLGKFVTDARSVVRLR